MCVCESVIRITPLQNKKKPLITKPKLRQISILFLQKNQKGGRGGGQPGSFGTTQQHQNLHFSKTEKKNKNQKKGASTAPAAS